LRHFSASSPDVRLELVLTTSIAAGDQLHNRKLDAAFVYKLPSNLREFGSHTIRVERFVLALPRAHPLAKRKRVMLRDLREEPFVWYPRSAANFVYDPVLSACYTAGFPLKIVHEVNSPTTMLSLVAGGSGSLSSSSPQRERSPTASS